MGMLLSILIAIIFGALVLFLFFRPTKSRTPILLVGPRSTGKTTALTRLLGIDAPTVSTIGQHAYIIDGRKVIECPPQDSGPFEIRFGLDPAFRHIFFLKNQEELKEFPDLSPYDITFVHWKDSSENAQVPGVICLAESADRLLEIIRG